MKNRYETKLSKTHDTDSFDLHNAANTLLRQPARIGICSFISGQVFTLWLISSSLSLNESPGWALDMDLLEGLSNDDVEIIKVVDVEKGKIYTATLVDFQNSGIPHFHPQYGPQLCLPFSLWKVTSIEIGTE